MTALLDIVESYDKVTNLINSDKGKSVEFADSYKVYNDMVTELLISGYRFDTKTKSIVKYTVVTDLLKEVQKSGIQGESLEHQLLAFYKSLDKKTAYDWIDKLYPNKNKKTVIEACRYTLNVLQKQFSTDDDYALLFCKFVQLNAILDLGIF